MGRRACPQESRTACWADSAGVGLKSTPLPGPHPGLKCRMKKAEGVEDRPHPQPLSHPMGEGGVCSPQKAEGRRKKEEGVWRDGPSATARGRRSAPSLPRGGERQKAECRMQKGQMSCEPDVPTPQRPRRATMVALRRSAAHRPCQGAIFARLFRVSFTPKGPGQRHLSRSLIGPQKNLFTIPRLYGMNLPVMQTVNAPKAFGAARRHYGKPKLRNSERAMKSAGSAARGHHGGGKPQRAERTPRIRAWSSGWDCKRGILEHALGEGVIKFLTVRNLICRCLEGGYRNSRGRQGRLRRMLLAGRALDCVLQIVGAARGHCGLGRVPAASTDLQFGQESCHSCHLFHS
jgi:hypothetical protein